MQTLVIPKPVEIRPGILAFSVTLDYDNGHSEFTPDGAYKWIAKPMTADVLVEIEVANAILSIGRRAAKNKGRKAHQGFITAKATNVRGKQ